MQIATGEAVDIRSTAPPKPEFMILNTEFMILNTEFIIFVTEFMIFNT